MTYQIYSQQQLRCKSLDQLKRIYNEIGCTTTVQDRRCKDAWRSAIARYQESKLQKVDEQGIAQSEFNQYIADQAQAVAPEELAVREISFYHHEYYALDRLIAAIDYDNDLTQPWVVTINNAEVFRAATPMMCDRYIRIHYKDGSLAVQEQETPTSTGNEIMFQIATECDKYGLELLDDGIYTSDGEKLGEVGCTHNNSQLPSRNSQLNTVPKSKKPCTCNDSINNSLHNCELRTANCELLWWFARVNQKRTFCDSVEDAVWLLQISDELPSTNEYLQYHPLEQLSSGELQGLFETAALVAV